MIHRWGTSGGEGRGAVACEAPEVEKVNESTREKPDEGEDISDP
ncbi:hypothetical protein BRARA_I01512 [Brassica rapa]|uniref:Uncharacterized protein n=1 Tax=Brassica campestris TaxID=3711 RepID=A0A397XTZ3_BRACM|nr:hypothetical protein BRARA_I01512 [Brassica rapa]